MTIRTETKQNLLVITYSAEFESGIEDGLVWYFHGDTPQQPVTEEDVIDFLKENFIEIALEGWLDALSSTEGEVYGIFQTDSKGKVYLIPIEDTPGAIMRLRLTPTSKNGQIKKIKYAADYEL